MADFRQRLSSGAPIVADGGMGALLTGVAAGLRCPEEANLLAPESVVAVHASYIAAGAELIETNTFGANRRKLAARGLDHELEAINSAGVRLAREARDVSGRDVMIAGAIGPLGELEMLDRDAHGPLYAEQARVLEGRGVDLFMVETFFDVDDLVAAVEAVRAVSSLPIVALLTFDEEAEAAGGIDAAEAAAPARDARRRGDRDEPRGRPPQRPHRDRGHARPGPPPRRAAERRPREHRRRAGRLPALDAGVLRRVRGPGFGPGSPDRGRLLRDDSRPDRGGPRRARGRPCSARRPGDAGDRRGTAPPRRRGRDPARAALRRGDWVVSVELDPPKGGTNEAMIEVARTLHASGAVGFVDVNDNPMARARMNALMASIAIEREAGIETIPHVTPRDTTVMGLEGVLLGAHAEGVRNILAVTGDPPHVGDYPGSRGVYEIDSIGLVHLLARLNQGVDYVGKAIDRPTSFFIGVAVNPSADDPDLELERFEQKLEAGAQFAMTQALFDVDGLERFRERLGGTWPIPVLAGVWPLRSHAMALRLHNEVPGISVPEPVLETLAAPAPTRPPPGSSSRASCSSRCTAASPAST